MKMSTFYKFFTGQKQDPKESAFITIDKKHMDPKTVDWVKETGNIPYTRNEANSRPGEKLPYVPIPDEHINNSIKSYKNVNVTVVTGSIPYDE